MQPFPTKLPLLGSTERLILQPGLYSQGLFVAVYLHYRLSLYVSTPAFNSEQPPTLLSEAPRVRSDLIKSLLE